MSEAFDKYGRDYGALVNESIRFSGLKVDFFTRAKARHLIQACSRFAGDSRKLRALDVGCGAGGIHPYLSGAFGSITGVDVSAEMLAQARQTSPDVDYRQYDGVTLPFPDEAFEVAYAICVLHHVPEQNWPRFVAEMARVTARPGLVAIFEHNPYNPLTRRAVNRCEFDNDATLLTAGRARGLLGGAGLSSARARHILFAPVEGRPGALLDRWFGWCPLGAQYYAAAVKL
jgi:SAM-dependent methyltransferase